MSNDPRLGQRLISQMRLAKAESAIERSIFRALKRHEDLAIEAMKAEGVQAAVPVDPYQLIMWINTVDHFSRPVVDSQIKDFSDWVTRWMQLPSETRVSILGRIDVMALVDQYLANIVTLGSRTAEGVLGAINQGVANGESIPNLVKRIQEQFDVGRVNATRIARTETHKAAERTTWLSAREVQTVTGDVVVKQWLSTFDHRTRYEHAIADGQAVALDANFTVGQAEGPYPGELGWAEHDINCRCSTTYRLLEPGETLPEPQTEAQREANESLWREKIREFEEAEAERKALEDD